MMSPASKSKKRPGTTLANSNLIITVPANWSPFYKSYIKSYNTGALMTLDLNFASSSVRNIYCFDFPCFPLKGFLC